MEAVVTCTKRIASAGLRLKRCMAVFVVALVPEVAFAQAAAPPVPALEAAGLSTIYVMDDAGHETKGHLLHLDAQSLVMSVDGVERRFEVAHIREIDKRGDSLRNGFIAGAAFGALAGLIGSGLADCPGSHSSDSCAGARVGFFLASTGIYAAIGTGIDALIPGRTVVYKALPVPTAAGAQAYRLSGRRLAMNVSVKW
jgi:hypothetical protein